MATVVPPSSIKELSQVLASVDVARLHALDGKGSLVLLHFTAGAWLLTHGPSRNILCSQVAGRPGGILVLKQISLEYFCWHQREAQWHSSRLEKLVGSISKHQINLQELGSSGQSPGGHLLQTCLVI